MLLGKINRDRHTLLELGKNTSYLLHDIADHLTTATVNLESLLPEKRILLSVHCLKEIQAMVIATKQQLRCEEDAAFFSPDREKR